MSELSERVKALQTMPLLGDLPHGDLETLARRVKSEQHPAGREILKQGSSGASAYLIVSGICEVRRKTGSASRRIAFLEPGAVFGELSIVAPAPRSASVIAHQEVEVFVLTGTDFNTALRNNKSMALRLVRLLAERLQRYADELGQLK